MSVVVIGLGNPILGDDGIGCDYAIIIDAIVTGNQPLGTVSKFTLDMLSDFAAGHTTSTHDTSLQTAMGVGRATGAKLPLPDHIWFVTIESQNRYEFSEAICKPVAKAVPTAIDTVITILDTIQLEKK